MASLRRLASEVSPYIDVHVSCTALKDKDFFSKSDPCCVLFADRGGTWVEIGRTETIKNNLNPQFSHTFGLDYRFEEVQRLKFSVYDIDTKSAKLTDDDFIGYCECSLGELVSNSPFTRPLYMKPEKKAGKASITLRAEERTSLNEKLLLQFSGAKLDNKDFLSKSDPYLEFHRQMPDGAFQVVHRTEVIKNDLNPTWKPCEIKASTLCGSNIKALIRVDCHDWNDNGVPDLIGSFETSLEELMSGSSRQIKWPLINLKKKAKKKSYENSGTVTLLSCQVSTENSFLDYLLGGLQINFTVGIDFTASNGNPANEQSLHFMNAHQPNHYVRAIQSLGTVIKDYDSDQMFPALGYGAKIPPHMEVSHSFPLNFNATNPYCAGVQGIVDAYTACVNKVELYGPTNFAPIILHVAQFAAAAQKEKAAKNYFVLLIITDGVISDLTDTVRAIVYASQLPFSIIIVGVGSADFKAMDVLDADGALLKDDRGNTARRDIVQFVAFRDFEYGSPDALAKKVLADLPDQVCGYYQMNGILPGPPRELL
jgi:hypothetical protein